MKIFYFLAQIYLNFRTSEKNLKFPPQSRTCWVGQGGEVGKHFLGSCDKLGQTPFLEILQSHCLHQGLFDHFIPTL